MAGYTAPSIVDLGSVSELTLSTIYKDSGSGDVIVIAGVSIPVPGTGVTGVS